MKGVEKKMFFEIGLVMAVIAILSLVVIPERSDYKFFVFLACGIMFVTFMVYGGFFAFQHETKEITITEKFVRGNYQYVVGDDKVTYNVVSLQDYPQLHVGSKYRVNIAINNDAKNLGRSMEIYNLDGIVGEA